MNQQISKKIFFNKSTLFNLKAELIRKQEDILKKKHLPEHNPKNHKPATKSAPTTHDLEQKPSLRDNLTSIDAEELEACRKAKLALERKTELYEHLSNSKCSESSKLVSNFLVDFKTKKEEAVLHEPSTSLTLNDDTRAEDQYDDSEWTEYIDCLGRTRKCLKSELDVFLERDKALFRTMNKQNSPTQNVDYENESSRQQPEKPFLVQKTYDYLQSLREKWEVKEKELLAKDKDVHYQDLLFDEARMHGVGYYSFSTDETVRSKQMEDLMKRRKETIEAQKEAEELREKRDSLMAARVEAARARRRARAGLPPDPPADKQKDFTACLLEFLNEKKNEADAEALEKDKKIKEEQEKERQKLRDAFVREWDVGKEGVNDKIKRFKVLTQDEYVEQQRSKRMNEFAPLRASTSSSLDNNNEYDVHGRIISTDATSGHKKSWDDVRPETKTSAPEIIDTEWEQKGLYFSTTTNKNNCKKTFKTRGYTEERGTLIQDEISAREQEEGVKNANRSKIEKRKINDCIGNEVPPPATYEYYGPTPKQSRSQKPFESDIREAYAQGAKSLESKGSVKKLPAHYDFTFV